MKRRRSPSDDIICIYSGRFQLPHEGHYSAYKELCKRFKTVFIASTNCFDDSNSDSPFTFAERKVLLQYLGIPEDNIRQVANPYICSEIVTTYSSDTVVVFAVGEKNRDRFTFDNKANGNLGYLQSFAGHKNNLRGQSSHAYVTFIKNKINEDNEIISSTKFRNNYRLISDVEDRRKYTFKLFGNGRDSFQILERLISYD